MRVNSLVLRDFIPFSDSGISELKINFTADVQVIIGVSGSGKSTLLRQTSLYPPVRSLFGKKGFKSIVVEKDGVEYRLETEFEKPSSPHLFFEENNDENLNIGRTTDIQRELISDTLSITPLIDDLIMNRYTFLKWTPAKRKEFIMVVNPDQISFVQVHLKQISSKIRACKNNLSRLQSKKILLEQEFISPEALEDIIKEKSDIDTDLGMFQQYLMDIEVGLRTIPSISSVPYDIRNIIKTLKNNRYQLAKLSHIERNDKSRSSIRDTLIGHSAAAEQKTINIKQSIAELTNALSELETRYRDLAPEEGSDDIDLTIRRLEMERDKLSTAPPVFELSVEELNKRYVEWEDLRSRLLTFVNCDVSLYSRKKRNHRENLLQNLSYRKSSLEMNLSDLETRYEALSKRHNLSPNDIPQAPCAKEKCPLYTHFMGEYQNTEEQRQTVSKSINQVKHKQKRIHILIDALTDYFNRSKSYHEQIRWLISYARENPVLHHILRQMDILIVLKNNPNRIINNLRDAYNHIEKWLQLKSILSDLDTAYSLKKRLASSENSEVVNLVVDIEKAKKSLYTLRKRLEMACRAKQSSIKYLDEISKYDSIKHTVLTIQDMHKSQVENLANTHEKDSLNFFKSRIDNIRSDRFMRLSEIERTLRSQSTLKTRYEEDVLVEIAQIEKEMRDLEQIEKSLIAIPRESTIDFLNKLFDQANKLIRSVWTIPLEIELLTVEDPLNYEFYVTGDNTSIRELSDCSDGQTEIITLALNLSLRILLGHVNIPLCLDEPGRTLDATHRSNTILLLKRLLDDGIVSQLFIVSHDAFMHESLSNSETFAIRDENIVLPSGDYNTHVEMI